MTLAHARALLKAGAAEVEHSAASDLAGLRGVVRWASRWSPVVSEDVFEDAGGRALHGIVADLTGCEHLFGGEERMVRDVADALVRLGLTARLGVAGTVGAAWAVARYAPGAVVAVAPGGEAAALSPLPIGCLRLDAAGLESLHEVSVFTVGELLRLPRASLASRCGEGVPRMLDLALGRGGVIPEMVQRVPERTAPRVRVELPGGTTRRESLEEASREGLRRLCAALEHTRQGVRRLDATYERLDLREGTGKGLEGAAGAGFGALRVTVHLTRPSRDARHLWGLLRPKFERLHLGFGVEAVEFVAGEAAGLAHEQRRLLETGGPASDAGERGGTIDPALLDVLSNRLGADRVLAVERIASHRPERAFRARPVTEAAACVIADVPSLERPTRLFDPPRAARVVALWPDGPVHRVEFDDGGGPIARRIIATVGPERLGGEWWRGREPTRDYSRVQDERGVWWWLFREEGGAWFVHGVWG